MSTNYLRTFHKSSGFIFFILILIISYLCIKYWINAGDNLSTRAVFHGVLAFILFAVILMSILKASLLLPFI